MKVHTYEKAFLSLGGILLIACMGALVYATVSMKMMLPGASGRIDPHLVYSTAPFDHPGVHKTGPNHYDVVVVAQAWAFMPSDIHVPQNADVTLTATSADIIHGFYIEGSRVNMMLIPGQISRMDYRFTTPGEKRLLLCHEYCGLGHHTMFGHITVDPPAGTSTADATKAGGEAL